MIVKLNESALYGLGFDRAAVEVFRHLMRQIGAQAGGATLPEVAETQETLLLSEVFGGTTATSHNPAADEVFQEAPDCGAHIAVLSKRIDALCTQLASLSDATAQVREVKKYAEDIQINYALAPAATGVAWERPGRIGASTANTIRGTTLESTVTTGTAPLIIASTTNVPNLNASSLSGATFAAPGGIGSGTPGAGTFTRINATTGTVGLPALYLSTENTTGFYRIGANNWGYAISGTKVIDYGATTVTYSINSMATLTKSFHCYTAQYGMGTPDSDGLQVFCATGDKIRFGRRSAGLTFTEDMLIDAAGDVQVLTKFGCNTKAPQGAFALGAAATDLPTVIVLANNIQAALIANGIGS